MLLADDAILEYRYDRTTDYKTSNCLAGLKSDDWGGRGLDPGKNATL